MQLLLFCLFGVVLAQVSALTPLQCEEVNTYSDTCRTHFRYRAHHDWMPYANASSGNGIKWRVILDQYDYQTLLGSSFFQGTWKGVDMDGDGRSWTQGSGGTCTYQLRINSFNNLNSNNWVFTQAISYCDAVELIVNASVRFSGCTQRPDCENDFVYLHRFDTDNPNEADRVKPENYEYFDGNEGGSRLQQIGGTSETLILKRFLRPSTSHTYFAFQDIGTTGQVQRFMVYYKVCQNNDLGLARYPEVPLPPSGSNGRTMRMANCVEHAHNVTSLETYAYEDRCEQDVKCECDAGYQDSDDFNSCVACQAGYYKTVQNATCVPCPANSNSDKEAAVICDCDEGYFRADYEGAGVQCTAPPSEIPNELRVVSVCDTSVVLEWDKPVDVGRSDYDYDIFRKDSNNPDETIYIATGYVDHSEVVQYRVAGLTPSTSYTFSVCVHNGVSLHDSANDKLRIVSQQGTTRQGSIFVLNGVTLPSNSVVLREDIGEGESALSCQAAQCGDNIPVPELFYPQNSPVPVGAGSGNSMYSTSDPGVAYLNRIDSDMSPLGKYSCQITDTETGTTQIIFVKIATIVNADAPMMCPQTTPSTSPATPSTTPATPNTSPATPSTSPATPTTSQATPTTAHSTTTTPTPSGVGLTLELNGVEYASGSTISIEDIGDGNNALLCRTDRTDCCNGGNRYGEFIYPNNKAVGVMSAGEAMYRNRGIQMIRLNRNKNSPLAPQTGLYRCVIPDSNGVLQSISVNIIAALPPDSGMVICSQLTNPANGLVAVSNTPIVPDSTATYSCDDGHRLTGGSSVRVCSNDGMWTGEEPTCEVITCPPLQNPANGIVTQFGNTQGSEATYRCDSGYELAAGASNSRQCGASGLWSGEAPVCEVRCPPLDHPERGLVTIDGNRNEGSVATYTCNGGLMVLGPSTQTCQSDGTWSDKAPTCGNIRFQLNGQTYHNGSSLSLSSLGEGDNALWCITDKDMCCTAPNRAGEFYYPDNSAVSILAQTQDGLYRNRGFRVVRLNRRNGATPPTGWYRCEIPDDDEQLQSIFINLT